MSRDDVYFTRDKKGRLKWARIGLYAFIMIFALFSSRFAFYQSAYYFVLEAETVEFNSALIAFPWEIIIPVIVTGFLVVIWLTIVRKINLVSALSLFVLLGIIVFFFTFEVVILIKNAHAMIVNPAQPWVRRYLIGVTVIDTYDWDSLWIEATHFFWTIPVIVIITIIITDQKRRKDLFAGGTIGVEKQSRTRELSCVESGGKEICKITKEGKWK